MVTVDKHIPTAQAKKEEKSDSDGLTTAKYEEQ